MLKGHAPSWAAVVPAEKEPALDTRMIDYFRVVRCKNDLRPVLLSRVAEFKYQGLNFSQSDKVIRLIQTQGGRLTLCHMQQSVQRDQRPLSIRQLLKAKLNGFPRLSFPPQCLEPGFKCLDAFPILDV